MDVALVAHVEHQTVSGRVIDPVEGHRQLHGPQVGGQMPPRAGHALHQGPAQLPAQYFQLLPAQRLYVRRGGNMLQDQKRFTSSYG